MARLEAGFSNEEFVGYTFHGSPERRPRLWFLDRHLTLMSTHGWAVTHVETGLWSMDGPCGTEGDELGFADVHIRYRHLGVQKWTAVWRLTNVIIPHVETFGFDDTWRLGLWPD